MAVAKRQRRSEDQSEDFRQNLRAFFSCMAWRAIPGPLSKRNRRLDSLEAAEGLSFHSDTNMFKKVSLKESGKPIGFSQ